MKIVVFAGIILIAVSFYSFAPVICDELFQNACYKIHGTEHFYTVLPIFIPIFIIGVVLVWTGRKSDTKPQKN